MVKDLSKKNEKDLQNLLMDKKEELQKFSFDLAGSKTRDVKRGKNLKKDIARILTEIRLRAL